MAEKPEMDFLEDGRLANWDPSLRLSRCQRLLGRDEVFLSHFPPRMIGSGFCRIITDRRTAEVQSIFSHRAHNSWLKNTVAKLDPIVLLVAEDSRKMAFWVVYSEPLQF
ncbi:hypothetical protein E4U15_007482 [Claviceps sp. LM218 group G6]|nr:hypothetical protein E4U15_007482 [Claviceps sp. LM218 group G6]